MTHYILAMSDPFISDLSVETSTLETLLETM
jgi:hypothetical protein